MTAPKERLEETQLLVQEVLLSKQTRIPTVVKLRELGLTYREIGISLGITKQAAQFYYKLGTDKSYKDKDRKKQTVRAKLRNRRKSAFLRAVGKAQKTLGFE